MLGLKLTSVSSALPKLLSFVSYSFWTSNQDLRHAWYHNFFHQDRQYSIRAFLVPWNLPCGRGAWTWPLCTERQMLHPMSYPSSSPLLSPFREISERSHYNDCFYTLYLCTSITNALKNGLTFSIFTPCVHAHLLLLNHFKVCCRNHEMLECFYCPNDFLSQESSSTNQILYLVVFLCS